MVRRLNMLLARFSKVALGRIMVTNAMVITKLLHSLIPMSFALLMQNASSVTLGLSFMPLVTWLDRFVVIRFFVIL
eukprot:2812656-Ditylum_brightwellii.AAC.1